MSAHCYSCGSSWALATEGTGESERHLACGGLLNEQRYQECDHCDGMGIIERAETSHES